MREYKTTTEIIEEAKQGNIEFYRTLARMFNANPSMEISTMMSNTALTLVKSYGLTWEEVERLEIAQGGQSTLAGLKEIERGKAMKKNCKECKWCTYRPMAYESGMVNTCEKEGELATLSMAELLSDIKNGTCKFYEAGQPSTSTEPFYGQEVNYDF